MENPNNGIDILNNLGVDKKFINDMFSKYGKHASKLGMNQNDLKGIVDQIGDRVNSINTSVNNNKTNYNDQTQSRKQVKSAKTGFDRSRFPKV